VIFGVNASYRHVKREYRWDAILTKYDRLLTAVRQR